MTTQIEFIADPGRNLLTLRYRGHVTKTAFEEHREDVVVMLALLTPGFTVLADMSELETMDVECAPYISRVMDLARTNGVGKVVRVMPDLSKDIGINILSIIHYRGKVPIVTLSTLAEAQRELT